MLAAAMRLLFLAATSLRRRTNQVSSLPRAKPSKGGDAEPRDYREILLAMSAEPPATRFVGFLA